MKPLLHHRPRPTKRRALWLFTLFLTGLLVLTLADRWIFFAVRSDDADALKGKDWYQFLRTTGSLLTWIAIALTVGLHDAVSGRATPARRGLLLLGAPGLAGAMAELMKILIPRQRPVNNGVGDGEHVWGMPLERLFGVGNQGLASSHAAVAFGGAFMVARLFPGAGTPVMLLALGCAWTRMAAGAHFATDVYVAFWLAYVTSVLITLRGVTRGPMDVMPT